VLARRQLLVVLDNCEHVLAAAAELSGTLLPLADNIRVLATSREPLGLAGGGPLPAAARRPAAGGVDRSSVRLLVLCAGRSDPTWWWRLPRCGPVWARLPGVPAPVTPAAFGSGPARIDVRAVAPDDATAYRVERAADLPARKAARAPLLRDHRIHRPGGGDVGLGCWSRWLRWPQWVGGQGGDGSSCQLGPAPLCPGRQLPIWYGRGKASPHYRRRWVSPAAIRGQGREGVSIASNGTF
jgi:hypothetical protein